MSDPSFKPYAIGQVIGTRKITKVIASGSRMRDTRYAFTYACCGAAGETSHANIRNPAGKGKEVKCKNCSKRVLRNKPVTTFPVGSAIAGVMILEVTRQTGSQSTTMYRVKHGCCDAEAETTHRTLEQRRKRHTQLCASCGSLHKSIKTDPPAFSGPVVRYCWLINGRRVDEAMPMLGPMGPRWGSEAGRKADDSRGGVPDDD